MKIKKTLSLENKEIDRMRELQNEMDIAGIKKHSQSDIVGMAIMQYEWRKDFKGG